MDEKQALDVLNQGMNVALSAGAFKNTRDVSIISQALEVLAKFLVASSAGKAMKIEAKEPVVSEDTEDTEDTRKNDYDKK